MAILKDTLIQGACRVIGDAYFGTIKSGVWNGSTIANSYLTGSGAITIAGRSVSLGGSISLANLRSDLGLGSLAYISTVTASAGSNIDSVGTPSVSASVSGTQLTLTFNYLKGTLGELGDPGTAAGFGTPTVTVDNNTGTPGCTITTSGSNTAKVFNFAFTNLKGAKGDPGTNATTTSVFTSSSNGLAPAATSGNCTTAETSATHYYLCEDAKFRKLPANAFLNDNTATAASDILEGTNSGTLVKYAPYSSTSSDNTWVTNANNAGKLYLGTVNPSKTTRLNYNGYLYATKLYAGASEVVTSVAWDSTNKKLTIAKNGGSASDLVSFGTNAFNSTSYLPLSGGTMSGTLILTGGISSSGWTEGIRINDASNGWTTLTLGGTATSGTSAATWSFHTYQNNFYLANNGSSDFTNGLSCVDGSWNIKGSGLTYNSNTICHSGNIGSLSVAYATYSGTVYGAYTFNGGQQGPGYFGTNRVGFLMSNQTVNSDGYYKNWLYMDCYAGNDVGGTTALGLSRVEPRAFIMQSDYTRSSWNSSSEVITTYNLTSYALKNYGADSSRPNSSTFTLPSGANAVLMRSGATSGADIGIFYLSDDTAFVCNSADTGYSFAVYDTDVTSDFSSMSTAGFAVGQGYANVITRGTLETYGTHIIYPTGVDNSAYKSTLAIKQQNSDETYISSAGGWYDSGQSKPCFGITFNRFWTSNGSPYGETVCSGIYAVPIENWRGGLLFRVKNNTTAGGSPDRTALELRYDGDAAFGGNVYTNFLMSAGDFQVYSDGSLVFGDNYSTYDAKLAYYSGYFTVSVKGTNGGAEFYAGSYNSMAFSCSYIYCTSFYQSSDVRLKDKIKPISENIRQFVLKDNPERIRYGFIAQDLQKTNPELVSENKAGYLTVDYNSALCLMLSKAENKIVELEAKIEELLQLVKKS